MSRKIYVGNLPYELDDPEDTLKDLFSQIGEVISVRVVKDEATGSSKGYGFVEMTLVEDAEKAIKTLNGTVLLGRKVKISKAKKDISAEQEKSIWEECEEIDTIESYTEYISKYPKGNYIADAYNQRGLCHHYADQYDKAIADYTESLRIKPDAVVYSNRGLSYKDKGEYDKAIADFTEAIRLEPDNENRYFSRGKIFFALEDFDNAIADFNGAIMLEPDFAVAHGWRGLCFYKKSKYDRAILDFDNALSIAEEGEETGKEIVYCYRGICHKNLKRYEKAEKDFLKALELKPDYAEAKNELNDLRERMKTDSAKTTVTQRYEAPDMKTSVTERYNGDQPVTDRYESSKITDKYGQSHELDLWDSLQLKPGIDLVADRYRVEERIEEESGEAELYLCKDEQTGMKVILKLYKYKIAPKKSVLDNLLNLAHPDIVSLINYGMWSGRFYEVMEYCIGGSMMKHMPFTEEELKGYLPEIINGLNDCHQMNIVHRDIKPNNIYFRSHSKKDIVLGDFGISSVLDEGKDCRITTTLHLTDHYAAPELHHRVVSPKTDYYALGITLYHLLMGQSPFSDMDNQAIMKAKLSGNIQFQTHVSSKLKQLIKGLTYPEHEDRWGYKQIQSWLKGEEIFTDSGVKWEEVIYRKKEEPYPGYQQAKTPKELASVLDKFDVEKDLFRRYISQWVHHFDAELSDKIIEIEEKYDNKKKLGVLKLRYLLDPSLPLNIAEQSIYTIDELVKLLQSSNEDTLLALHNALIDEHIECWIEAAQEIERKEELLSRIKDIRNRLSQKHYKLSTFALLYTLKPSIPLQLAKDVYIRKLEEIEAILSKRPELEGTITYHLYEGLFEEWLRAAFPDKQQDIEFVTNCNKKYSTDKKLGTYAFRWHFCPSLPFPFEKNTKVMEVRTPEELAKLIDKDWTYGVRLMETGYIRAWLTETGRLKDPAEYDNTVNDHRYGRERKLEAVLHILDPKLPSPKPIADQKSIDLGKISTDSEKTVSVSIKNNGRGYLSGGISLTTTAGGFAINNQAIEGKPVTAQVTIRPLWLPVGSRQKTTLLVQTNGGKLEIPISYMVSAPIWKMIGKSILGGIVIGSTLGLFRYLLYKWAPIYRNNIVDWVAWDQIDNMPNIGKLTLMGLIIAGIFYGGFYYVKRFMNIKK